MFIEMIIKECKKENSGKIYIELFGRFLKVKTILPATDKDDYVKVEINKDQLDDAQKELAGFYAVHISKVIIAI